LSYPSSFRGFSGDAQSLVLPPYLFLRGSLLSKTLASPILGKMKKYHTACLGPAEKNGKIFHLDPKQGFLPGVGVL
jgi:hypothetical protein